MVTASTNGAAGIVPAVLPACSYSSYADAFSQAVNGIVLAYRHSPLDIGHRSNCMFKAADYLPLLEQLENFFAETHTKGKVTNPLDAATLKDRLSLAIATEGKSLERLNTDDIADYLRHAVKTGSPTYFNQLWGGFNPACFMGDMLTSATNTSMYTYEVAPVATLIEKALVAKMGSLVGFTNPEGQFTTGGSNGNLMAMAIARHKSVPTLKATGMSGMPKLIAFVSAESHYSFDKAAHLLGLGTEQLWKVPTDDQGRMQVSALKDLIAKARTQGAQPFFVVGTAATTVRGVYDPFAEIAAVAKEEKLWFHVDGAWGASVLLSPQHRHLMAGAELADSVVWDAHKLMGMTLMCSVLLVKHPGRMQNTFSTDASDYLFHADAEEPMDLGPSTMHCGRRVDAVKLWLAWQHLGDRGWESLINRFFDLAAQAESIIHHHPSLRLVSPRESLNLCFQYIPNNPNLAPNDFTLKIRQALLKEGVSMVNYAEVNGKTFFRLVICNNQTQPKDIDLLFEHLLAIAQQLETTCL